MHDYLTLDDAMRFEQEKRHKTVKALRELADAIENDSFVVDEVGIVSESKNHRVERCTYEVSGYRVGGE